MWGKDSRGSACSKWATGSGAPTRRSSAYRRWRRCSMRARSRRSAGARKSPTSGRPMTRCPRRPSAASTALLPSIRSSIRAAAYDFTNFSEEERQGLQTVPQVLVRTFRTPAASRFIWRRTPGRKFGMPEADGRALIEELPRPRHAAAIRLYPPLARPRSRHLGQPLHHAPRHRVRRPALETRHAARHGLRRSQFLRAGRHQGRSGVIESGWAKAHSAVPTPAQHRVGTLRFAHPSVTGLERSIPLCVVNSPGLASVRGRKAGHLMGFEEDRPTNLRMRGRSADWMGSGLT